MNAADEASTQPTRAPSGRLPALATEGKPFEDKARRNIAYLVVTGYLIVLAVSVAPVVLYFLRTKNLRLEDVKDLSTAMAAAVSSLSGVLGFVLGYYFKASEG